MKGAVQRAFDLEVMPLFLRDLCHFGLFFLDTVKKKYIKGSLLKNAQGCVFLKNKKISVVMDNIE